MGNDFCGYFEIRSRFLDNCYRYSRGKILRKESWVYGAESAGFAYEQMDGAYSSSLERLILEVVLMIVTADRSSEDYWIRSRMRAESYLRTVGFEDVVNLLSSYEVDELSEDMASIGLSALPVC